MRATSFKRTRIRPQCNDDQLLKILHIREPALGDDRNRQFSAFHIGLDRSNRPDNRGSRMIAAGHWRQLNRAIINGFRMIRMLSFAGRRHRIADTFHAADVVDQSQGVVRGRRRRGLIGGF